MSTAKTLFEVTHDDGTDATSPYLVLTEYAIERTTATLLIVRVVRRGGKDVRHQVRQRWSRKRLGVTVFSDAVDALNAYAATMDREASNRRVEAAKAERRASWARERVSDLLATRKERAP